MVTIYLSSLYYYVSFIYRYYNIDKSQFIGFFIGAGGWGLGCCVLEKVDSEKVKGVHNGIGEEKTANLSLYRII
jgi:hypothetical protein